MLRSRLHARTGAKARKLGERHVDLERRALVVDPVHRRHEIRRKLSRIQQTPKGHAGVGVARNDGCAIFVAADQGDARHAARPDQDAADLGVTLDVHAEIAGGPRERPGEAAHAPTHVAPHAPLAPRFAHDVMKEHVAGAGHRGARHGADDGVGGEGRLELVGLEPAIKQGSRGSGEDLDRVGGCRAETAERSAERQERPEVAHAGPQDVRRRRRDRRLDEGRHPIEHGFVRREAFGVARAELRDLAAVELGIRSEQERSAVEKRRERRRLPGKHLEPVPGEAQVAHDLLAEEAVDVGCRRDLEAGKGFLGHAGPADQVATLEHEDPQPGTGQVARRHQAVVARADDDRVVVPATHARIIADLRVDLRGGGW